MMSMADVAAFLHLGWDTVKRIFSADMEREAKKINLREVEFLGIDEVYLGKLHRFVTIVIDWKTGRILHVAKGRGENALRPFFRRLRLCKARIKAVATDMGAAYAAAVLKNLPGADLVIDRFHVVKLMNEKIDALRRALQREADAMGRRVIKGTRYLLLRGKENLSPERLPDLEAALKLNEPLSIAYYLKEELRTLWSHRDIQQMAAFLDDWITRAKESGIAVLSTFAKTLLAFRPAILNWAKHPISNGKLEGINNKIGAMQRLHYGLRDFHFFSLRLLTLHRAKHSFCG
jgi:transposase